MSALPKSYIQESYVRVNSPSPQKRPVSKPKKTTSNFPKSKELPVYLQVLLLLQKGSFGVACFSMATSVVLYLSTVSIPQQWSKEFRDLETLQRQERQLTTIGESLKYEIAQEAEQEALDFQPIESSNTVFIKAKPVIVSSQGNLKKSGELLQESVGLGY